MRKTSKKHVPTRKPKAKPRAVLTGRKIGYARVSTEDQNLDVQITALLAAGVALEDIYIEKISAVNAKRPQFRNMMKFVERGDELLVHSLSRLGRDVHQIHTILKELDTEGVKWRSITEPHFDTATAVGRFGIGMAAIMAQFERDQTVERTIRGMDAARARGMYLGAPKKVDDKKISQMQLMRERGVPIADIAAKFKIKPSTVYAKTRPKKSR